MQSINLTEEIAHEITFGRQNYIHKVWLKEKRKDESPKGGFFLLKQSRKPLYKLYKLFMVNDFA